MFYKLYYYYYYYYYSVELFNCHKKLGSHWTESMTRAAAH